jgi:hypothetical protein
MRLTFFDESPSLGDNSFPSPFKRFGAGETVVRFVQPTLPLWRF